MVPSLDKLAHDFNSSLDTSATRQQTMPPSPTKRAHTPQPSTPAHVAYPRLPVGSFDDSFGPDLEDSDNTPAGPAQTPTPATSIFRPRGATQDRNMMEHVLRTMTNLSNAMTNLSIEVTSLKSQANISTAPTAPAAPITAPPTPTPSPNKDMGKLSTFDGTRAAWRRWEAKARRKIQHDGHLIGSVDRQLGYLLNALEEDASQVAEDYQRYNHPFQSTDQLFEYLESLYGDPFERETARSKLQSLKMEDGPVDQVKKFQKYRDTFLQLISAAGKASETQATQVDNIHDFLRGLTPYVARQVTQQLRGFTNFNQYCQEVETIVRGNEVYRSFFPAPNRPRSAQNAAPSNNTGPSNNKTGSDNMNNPLSGRSFPTDVPQDVVDARRRRRACVNCGKPNHVWRDCYARTALQDPPRLLNTFGHPTPQKTRLAASTPRVDTAFTRSHAPPATPAPESDSEN